MAKRSKKSVGRTLSDPEAIGYGRPPEEHQFKRGHKGNPWGRKGKPKPKLNFLEEHQRVLIDGKWQSLTRNELINLALFREAFAGNVSAVKQLEARMAALKVQASSEPDALSPNEQEALERAILRRKRSEGPDKPDGENDGGEP